MSKQAISSLMNEARTALYNDHSLIISCSDGNFRTSRILFAILVKEFVREELLKDEESYLILQDHCLRDVQGLLHQSFFGTGLITDEVSSKFSFVNFALFKGPLVTESKLLEKPIFKCSICGKVLSDKNNLKKHADVVHFNIRNYGCDNCGKRFISRNDLSDHIRAVHEKRKEFICDLCGQALSTRHGLRMHKMIHTEGSKSIHCSKCDKTFRHSSTFRKHTARVHDFNPEKRLQCHICQKFYNHSEGLKRHLRKFHASTKPQFKCEICSVPFVFRYDLNKHKKRVHPSWSKN